LCTAASRRTTPRQRLIERDFKDASEAEKRKIVRENVARLYGFDFD
jgi:predicted TIM-barrel fold metal-dependent hydrolase